MPINAPSSAAKPRRRKISCRGSIHLRALRPLAEILHSLELELSQFREVACSSVYLFELQSAQSVEAEFLDGEAAEHRAIDHGAPQRRIAFVAHAGQIAHEAAGKAVAGTGRVVRLFERECRYAENTSLID